MVIPTVIPVVFQSVNGPGDASLILRYTTLITNAWFDAMAPDHPGLLIGIRSSAHSRVPSPATSPPT